MRTPPWALAARTTPPRGRWKDIDVTVKTHRLRTAGAALLTLAATLVFAGVAQAAAPTITSFTPTSGSLGSSVTVTGTNFFAGVPLTQNTVKFGGSGGTAATVTAATTTTITV